MKKRFIVKFINLLFNQEGKNLSPFPFPLSPPRGQSLVELLMAIGIAAILIPALLTGLIASRQGKVQQAQRTQAVSMMKETQEAVKGIKNSGWTTFANLSGKGALHPVISGSSWATASGAITTNDITQQFVVSDVYRNTSGAIVASSSGTLDPSTKQVDITLSWTQPLTSTITSTLYFARTSNSSYTQTTTNDFDAAGRTLTQTQIATTSGGQVTLESNRAKWCSPAYAKDAGGADISIALPDGPPVAVAATASGSVSTPNDVFVATAPYATSSVKLAYINVTANSVYPAATLRGKFTMDPAQYSPSPTPAVGLDNNFKTNDVKYYKSPGGKTYALLATNIPNKDVLAIQINDGTGDAYQDATHKIYKFWTYFNTKVYKPTTGMDTGFLDPSGNATDTGGQGNGYANPLKAYTDDTASNNYANDDNSGTSNINNCTDSGKDRHKFYDYGFSLPSGATINGIELRLDAWADNTANTPHLCVELSWDGGTSWTAVKQTPTLTASQATYTLGGSADTWGRTWSDTNFSNANFRVRVTDVASSTTRDFRLDWVGVKVYHGNGTTNDQTPFDYGARSLTVLGNTGYVAAGGYLYAFDLSNIDSKSSVSELDQIGCRIQLDGYDCKPGSPASDLKYDPGQTGTSWSDVGSPAHNTCADGGNIELYANNDLSGVTLGGHNYIYVAVGAGTMPEFEIVDATSVPNNGSSPGLGQYTCGRQAGGNANWQVVGSLDFNSLGNTEEAANSVYAKSDGQRAYVSSNGGIDGNSDGIADSKQFYIIDTSTPTAPKFLSTSSVATGSIATSGFYGGTGANLQMYPRRSMTVLNGTRAVLVGKDGVADATDAQEYQVLNLDTESGNPLPICGGLNYDLGFNDLSSVTEADGDNYVYMVSTASSNALKIVQGGPDQAYFTPGTYISSIFDATSSAAFNRFVATVDLPTTATSISAQVAVAPPGITGCSDATYQFVGPNGDPNAVFSAIGPAVGASISAAFPIGSYVSGGYQNPGRCFRYKAFLSSTDFSNTPVLKDMSWNYSP